MGDKKFSGKELALFHFLFLDGVRFSSQGANPAPPGIELPDS
jgi:hypothetical protein